MTIFQSKISKSLLAARQTGIAAMESNRVKTRKLDHLGAADVAASYATGVYNSSMFNLEVGGLVQDVQIDYNQALPGVDDILRKLKSAIEDIPPREPVPV